MKANINQGILDRFSSTGESWTDIACRVSSICVNNHDIYEYILNGYFIPGGQILRGAGFTNKVLYNSFVSPVEDEEPVKNIAHRITSWTELGAGVGVNVSNWIRNQENDESTALNLIVEEICKSQQSLWEKGITRTATMINIDPDIEGIEDIALRISKVKEFRHVNLGVVLSDKFIANALIEGSKENQKMKLLSETTWNSGNPGFIFIDTVNSSHPFKGESLNTCNACAEQYLLPSEGCCLGAISLDKFICNNYVDYNLLEDCIEKSISYLDKVIDASSFPSARSKELAYNRRRIGLGIMGLGSLYDKLDIEYDSDDAFILSNEIASKFKMFSIKASQQLALNLGLFPDFEKSDIEQYQRNSYLNSIAPTGAISMIFNSSSGIEPIFGSKITKNGIVVNLSDKKDNDMYSIHSKGQVEQLAIWQKYIDGGISKTLNLTEKSTVDDIFDSILMAWNRGAKGISIYRQNSRNNAFLIG